ncbi:hypothetical protein [Nocardia africana]|uniref:Type IV secretory pathway, VirB4 components n=1 Tax=Nocardia africana TaxID=134964 RepID=A0A379X4M0_9NOCA|nr:hypothetical protein [Nocardia africana]MCC3318431.1 hypothetical protein [Nocardia africana]SUH71893.1 Type IV secretory pathway, VirB4 components [Nocardia africana]
MSRRVVSNEPIASSRDKPGLGQKVLAPDARAKLERRVANSNPLLAAPARLRLHVDDNRRLAQRIRADESSGGQASVVRVTKSGIVGPGGGRSRSVGRPAEYRGTTAQVAGLWPWCVGASAPLIGTPLGPHLDTGEPVCFAPMNYFTRGIITAPSLFVLGLNGFGKSSLVRRLVLGAVAQGITPLILADVKPDYRDTVAAVGGQIVDLGYGHGKLNPLDGGVMALALRRLDQLQMPEAAESLRTELRARQTTLIAGLVELSRGRKVADFEETLISTTLRLLFTPKHSGGHGFTLESPPIMQDLADVISAGGAELHEDAGAYTEDEYQSATIHLRRSLRALTRGNFGQVFNGHTTTPLDLDSVAICVDVSHIPKNDKKLKAAVMLASWSAGFGAVESLNLLAEVGVEKQRYFQVVMDELWQVLGLGDFMIERVDELTRLQRGLATELIMISHTIKDLQALDSAAASRALGFLERARAKVFGALPPEEIRRLDSIVPFTEAEAAMVTSWSAPQALTGESARRSGPRPLPPGLGKFLLKIGEDRSPGIPFRVRLAEAEQRYGIHETSRMFERFGRRDVDDEQEAAS